MMRLLLLTAPMASALSGIAVGFVVDWCLDQFWWTSSEKSGEKAGAKDGGKDSDDEDDNMTSKPMNRSPIGRKQKSSTAPATKSTRRPASSSPQQKMVDSFHNVFVQVWELYNSPQARVIRLAAVAVLVAYAFSQVPKVQEFKEHSYNYARQMSNPMLVFKARLNNGQEVVINDYREAYWWLRDHTPPTSRVMAWWDYGYQITGIGNRTTIADGNTWNHEHIATLGYCLTSPVKQAHNLIRHLADYVLVWSGGGGDDLAKSPHMARIANSVYNDLCPDDPTCSHFGFYQDGKPTPMMAKSLLFNLISAGMRPGATVDSNLFKEVYTSPYRLVRIYKVMNVSVESKKWVMDPNNRKCDAPGSWYCSGQYPPAEPVQNLLKKKRDFKQLEDFNRGGSTKGNKYYEEYMANMEGRRTAGQQQKAEQRSSGQDESNWANSEETTRMWNLIKENDMQTLQAWLSTDKTIVHMRSEDGRGPLWWAYEMKNKDAIALLKKYGAKETEKDRAGKKPKDLA